MLGLIEKGYNAFLKYRRNRYIQNLKNKGLNLGKNVLIVDTFFFDPSHCYLIAIGDNCTICPNVRLIAHDASTKNHLGYTKFGKITIGENCFIGDSTIILPNVSIGANSIIGAGSVVTKNIPADTVAAGNPAKPICPLEDYLSKVKKQAGPEARIFGRDYYIENLTPKKLKGLLDAVNDSIGFIN